ncbi:hypothetical protein HPP92_024122 [Vanilla planifolia]|uniref:Uncharacterized protein n=1 Tax=Vanilla planifolia TaxID=51239 RepID=A0A835PMY5_VANPL|nr:hypothetical protein HPP92_024122 [Vanilla planifolia]
MKAAIVDGSSSAAICCLIVHRQRKLSLFSHSSSIKALALPLPFSISSHLRRRRRGRRPEPDKSFGKKSSSEDRTVEFSIDFDDISVRTTANLERLFYSSKAKVHHFFSSGVEAFQDLKYSVRVERGNHIVFSCRRSSIEFIWNLFIWSVVVVLAFRMLLWLWSLRRKWDIGGWWVIRRDRSLGGREVVVGRREKLREPLWRDFKSSLNPLSLEAGIGSPTKEALIIKKKNDKDEKLPKWWPVSMPYRAALFRKEDAQREADKLVKGNY